MSFMPKGNHIGDDQVNTLVTDKWHQIGDNQSMIEPELSFLAGLLVERGIRPAEFARRVGVSKQQIHKLLGRKNQTAVWALRLAPHLGIPWTDLVESKTSSEVAPDIESRVTVGKSAPLVGEPLNDLDELALIGMWRKLSFTKKAALFAYLGADDMPSLRKTM